MSNFSDNVENDAKKSKNAMQTAGRAGRNAVKKTNKLAKKVGKNTKQLIPIPLKAKIALGVIFAAILAISSLVGGTGGIYSNENTHIYTSQIDENFPALVDMSSSEKKKDTYKKDDAIRAMSKYIGIIHEKVEEERDSDINDTIEQEIAKNGWDKSETFAQIDDQSDFSQGTTLSGETNNDSDGDYDSDSDEIGSYIVKKAREYIGPNYVSGGVKIGKHGHNACDCSGFTQSLYKKYAHVNLPRTAQDQGKTGKIIGHSQSDLKKAKLGDLIVYTGSAHVAIFSGKRKGKYYQVHCTTGFKHDGVVETALHRPQDIVSITRVLKSNNTSKKSNIKWKKLGTLDVTYYCKYCAAGGDQASRKGKLSPGDVALPKRYLDKVPYDSHLKIGKNGKKIYRLNDTGSTDSIDIFLKPKDGKCHCNDNKHGRKKNKTIYYSTDPGISVNTKGKLEDTEKTGFTTKVKKVSKIPKAVPQSGILADYTIYDTISWVEPCRSVFDKWKDKGRKSKRGDATINGFYLVAVSPLFGDTGDAITIVLRDGTKINCIVADVKGADAPNWSKDGKRYGHSYGGGFSLVEFEKISKKDLDLKGWKGKKVDKIINYGKYNGIDINGADGSGDGTDTEITIEDLKILSAYSVSLANLQMYEKEGKVKRIAPSTGYRMSGNKQYSLVDQNGKKIDVKLKGDGSIDFEKDIEEKMSKYVKKCHAKGETAFFDVTFQEGSDGSTTHTKTDTLEIPIKNKDGTKDIKTIERTKKYGVPIVKNKNISEICLPMFNVKPDNKYVNGPSITNADAIIELTKNTIAIYFDGDPSQVDNMSEAIDGELQNAYEWPAPNSKSKKKYKLKKKTLVFKGKEDDPVVSIADGVIESITTDKDALNNKVNITEDNNLDLSMQSTVKEATPKIVVISHEKGTVKSIYKGVMICGGIKQKKKIKKGDQIGTFSSTKKMVFQVKVNKKFVNPLQFLQSVGSGKLIWPCKSGWTFGRGWGGWTGTSNINHIHQGIDITAPGGAGAPVLAMDNGVVVTPLTWHNCRGWYLVIKHSNKLYTEYQHLSPKSKGIVKKGQLVRKGQKIARQGNSYMAKGSGNSDITDSLGVCGIHIHFEVYPKYPVRGGCIPWETSFRGETYDPLKFLPKAHQVPALYSKNIGKIGHGKY